MANFGLDFTTSDKVKEASKPHLPAYKPSFSGGIAFFVYLVITALLALLVITFFTRKKKRAEDSKKKRHSRWDHFDKICQQRGLSEEEIRVLKTSLLEIGASTPSRPLSSPEAFNEITAAEIRRTAGEGMCDAIFRKLFPRSSDSWLPSEAGLSGTRTLQSEQRVQLHFENTPGTFNCAVLNIADESFVVSLPKKNGRRLQPKKEEGVEGFMERGGALYAFTSRVIENMTGGVFACRIAHAEGKEQSTELRRSRVPLRQEIQFGHTVINGASGGVPPIKSRYIGSLRQLSATGGTIATPASHRFEAGDQVEFPLRVFPEDPIHTISGTIVYACPLDPVQGGGHTLHLEFRQLNEDAKGTIKRIVARKQS